MHQQGQLLALISPLLYVPIIVHFRDELLSHLLLLLLVCVSFTIIGQP